MIVIIDNYGSFTYNLYQMVASFYPHVEVISNKTVKLNELERLQPKALFLTSGPGIPDEQPINKELIRSFAPKIPILGISLGHSAIAECFGANIEPIDYFDHGKAIDIFHHGEAIFSQMPNPFQGGCYHAFVVSKKQFPPSLKILAESKDGTIMAIRHHTYSCFGVQFYPETVLTPQGNILLQNFIKMRAED